MSSFAGSVRNDSINTTTKVRAKVRKKKRAEIPASIKEVGLVVMLAATLVVLMVAFSAYSAKLQTENNQLQESNAHLQADIDSLNEQIVERTKIENITNTATTKLGMIYPTSENCINIGTDAAEDDNSLAAAIKNEAYN